MKKSTVNIVRELVSQMKFTFTIKSVTDNLNGTYLLTTGRTHYLQKNSNTIFVIAGNNYEILDVVINESVLVKGSVLPVVSKFDLPSPFFCHGSITQVNMENTQIVDMKDKIPMVYLLRPFSEDVDAMDENDPLIERQPALTLFFLTEANFSEWTSDDYDDNAIEPMWGMLNTFIETCKASEGIGLLDGYRVEDKIKFANYNFKGGDKMLFNDNLSGKQLDITLPIYGTCCDIYC